MWPFSKEPSGDHNNEEYSIEHVPVTTLYRWFMYDMNVEHPNAHLDVFNITAVSEEGDEKERQESEIRAERITPLLPFLNLYANMNAKYIFEMQKPDLLKSSEVSLEKLEEESDAIMAFYRQITLAGLVTTLSGALELGILSADGSDTSID